MTVVRQDAWNQEEDQLLASVVIRHIKEGSTQLAAFEEVGERLSRTSAACGFRWNSLIRKQHERDIAEAKKKRKERTKAKSGRGNAALTAHSYVEKEAVPALSSLDEVILFLKNYKQAEEMRTASSVQKKLEGLAQQNKDYEERLQALQHDYTMMCEEYKGLLEIIERARRLVDGASNHHVSFAIEGMKREK
ncbi:Exonuclease SbcC, putative [Fictibacillus macauensis ZFHKF-1]|uniref:Exonuclease SbcC, putative n=1 Tax=Fictibacillus macauensis ZFHKF-1 TaxID=1196324 RepID=I8UDW2_9BACL|nr:RsfA family transcriptional regulator [Fictibacillus macauensis]EIT84978.1 Exonuclease SbcC, putative [Fictibacillus macauensis ZFHKF-1]